MTNLERIQTGALDYVVDLIYDGCPPTKICPVLFKYSDDPSNCRICWRTWLLGNCDDADMNFFNPELEEGDLDEQDSEIEYLL